jgi:serine-type D-Ala-D-Ala carboxypeptidase/endopeptidase
MSIDSHRHETKPGAMKQLVFILLSILLAADAAASPQAPDYRPNPLTFELLQRLQAEEYPACLVMAIVRAKGKDEVSFACSRNAPPAQLDNDSVFEIGSVSKAFTGILLAEMAERGEVSLEDPLAKYLPERVTVPAQGERKITLLDLATHTSGLPRLPSRLAPAHVRNPYADLTAEQIYASLAEAQLEGAIGTRYAYSNFGFMLLSHALARAAGKDFETLIAERIFKPLGMESTHIDLTEEQRNKVVSGSDVKFAMGTRWDFPVAFAGAGGIKSSVDDMAKFVRANLDPPDNALGRALQRAQSVQRTVNATFDLGLGWHQLKRKAGVMVQHAGQTGGYHSFVAFDVKKGLGVVVLVNADLDFDDLGMHIVDATFPLKTVRIAVAIDDTLLKEYLGEYQPRSGLLVTLTGGNGRIFATVAGYGTQEAFAESRDKLFLRAADVQMALQRDSGGRVSGMKFTQSGHSIEGGKIKQGVITDFAVDKPRDYVGVYQITPDAAMIIYLDESKLMARLSAQRAAEIYCGARDEFFYRSVIAQISFRRDGEGNVVALTLHQNGRDQEAVKVK